MNKQREILQQLYNKFGDFEVQEEYSIGKYGKRTPISVIKDFETIKHRKIFTNELVLETDEISVENNKKIAMNICNVLTKNGFKYSCWFSGNKSFHIHIFFNKISFEKELVTPEERTYCKNLFAKELCKGFEGYYELLDKAKFNENNMIRLEYSTHLKTGKIKEPELFPINYYENEMFPELIKETKKHFSEKKQIVQIDIQNIKCPLLEYALKTKLPEGNRNQVLCKNACAILSESELKQLAQIQEMPEKQVVSWKNKNIKYNIFEMMNYAKEIKLIHLFDEFLEKEVVA